MKKGIFMKNEFKWTFVLLIIVVLLGGLMSCENLFDDLKLSENIKSSEKTITSFSIEEWVGVISETTITVTVPYGTDVTALKPIFTLSEKAIVKIGAKIQVSGNTVNDFTNPQTYVVTAEDESTQSYIVTVNISAPSQYKINYKDMYGKDFTGNITGLPTKHTYDTPTLLVASEKESATFEGWYMTSDCEGTAVTILGATEYTSDITLYAKWIIINTYAASEAAVEISKLSFGEYRIIVTEPITSDNIIAIRDAITKNNNNLKIYLDLSQTSLTSLPDSAFKFCIGLIEVTMPSTVTNISPFAFYGCQGLKSVEIPDKVEKIEFSTFNGCIKLTSMMIPSCVTSIEGTAFDDCTGLVKFEVEAENTTYMASADGILFSYDEKTIVRYPAGKNGESYEIPSNVTSIGLNAFSYCTGLTSITIPDNVTSIGSDAFSNCSGLKSITIPAKVTGIENSLFLCCIGLESVDMSGVTSIGQNAFFGCTGLTNFTIPSKVTKIGGCAFYRCTGLTSVTFEGTGTWYTSPSDYTNGTQRVVSDTGTNVTNLIKKSSEDLNGFADFCWYKE